MIVGISRGFLNAPEDVNKREDEIMHKRFSPIKEKFDWLLQEYNDGWLLHLYKRISGVGMCQNEPSEHVDTIGAAIFAELFEKFEEKYNK